MSRLDTNYGKVDPIGVRATANSGLEATRSASGARVRAVVQLRRSDEPNILLHGSPPIHSCIADLSAAGADRNYVIVFKSGSDATSITICRD
jgi:hypothetical protein